MLNNDGALVYYILVQFVGAIMLHETPFKYVTYEHFYRINQ